jgi:hypothetical protein
VDTGKVAALIGAKRVRRASPDFVRAATGQAIGGVAPVGHPAPLRTLVDRDLAQYDEVWAAGSSELSRFLSLVAMVCACSPPGGAEFEMTFWAGAEARSDPRVIDVPRGKWRIILNLFILPTRPQKSAAKYARIWDPITGSPLMHYTRRQVELLQLAMPNVPIRFGMQVGNPPVGDVVKEMLSEKEFVIKQLESYIHN